MFSKNSGWDIYLTLIFEDKFSDDHKAPTCRRSWSWCGSTRVVVIEWSSWSQIQCTLYICTFVRAQVIWEMPHAVSPFATSCSGNSRVFKTSSNNFRQRFLLRSVVPHACRGRSRRSGIPATYEEVPALQERHREHREHLISHTWLATPRCTHTFTTAGTSTSYSQTECWAIYTTVDGCHFKIAGEDVKEPKMLQQLWPIVNQP